MWCWLYLRHQIQAVALCCQKKGPGSKSFGLQVLNDKVAMSMATQRSNFHVRKAMGEISSEIFGGPKSQKNREKWQGDYLAFGLGDDGKWHTLFEGDYFLVEVALRSGFLRFSWLVVLCFYVGKWPSIFFWVVLFYYQKKPIEKEAGFAAKYLLRLMDWQQRSASKPRIPTMMRNGTCDIPSSFKVLLMDKILHHQGW